MDATETTLDSIYEQADRLSDVDKLELIARLATSVRGHAAADQSEVSPDEKRRLTKAEIKREYQQKQTDLIDRKSASKVRRSSYGVLAHLGPAPSEQDIAEAREDMMRNFPREDIV